MDGIAAWLAQLRWDSMLDLLIANVCGGEKEEET